MNGRSLETIIGQQLEGFVQRKSTWYRQTVGGVLQAIELQKSAWGGQFYVNVAVWVSEIADMKPEAWPDVVRFDVTARITQLTPDETVTRALDLESRMLDRERKEAIQLAISTGALPFFDQLSSREAIKTSFDCGELSAFAVVVRVANF